MSENTTSANETEIAAPAEAPSMRMPWMDPPSGYRLRNLSGMLRRNRWLILGVVGTITLLAAAYAFIATPLYVAEARVIVEGEATAANAAMATLPGLAPPVDQTQIAVISSTALAGAAVDKLHLAANPLYNPALIKSPSGILSGPGRALIAALDWFTRLLRDDVPTPIDAANPAERARLQRDRLINAYLDGLEVVPEERTRVIAIRYASPRPEMAALAANTTAQLYVEGQAALTDGPENTIEGLNQRIKTLADQMTTAQQKLVDFQQSAAAIPVGSTSLYEQQLARLEDQLSQLRLTQGDANARAQQAQKIAADPDSPQAEAFLSDYPTIQQLRLQETKLTRELAELRTQYKESYPRVKDDVQSLEDVRNRRKIEIAKVVQVLSNQADLAKTRERQLTQEVDRIQSMIQQQREADATKTGLEADVKNSQETYNAALARLRDLQTSRKTDGPVTRVISQATVPTVPSYPPKAKIIGIAFAVSLMLGLGLAAGTEWFESGFRTRTQLETETGLGVLGMIPLIDVATLGGMSPYARAINEPNSTYGEAIRALRANLLLIRGEAKSRSILVTSAVPGESKTTTALALAATAAHAGKSAVIIECDVLRPSLYGALNCPQAPGLSEYLSGIATIQQVVRIDPLSGVRYISAGSPVQNASDMLGGDGLRALILALREAFEVVVIDSPPVLAVSDTLLIQRLVDETVMLVRWQKTPRDIVFAALKLIAESGGTIAGVVMTQVDMRKHASFEYGGHGEQYYGAYRSYHSDTALEDPKVPPY